MDTASASSRTPLKIGSAAVIGAGTMGSQIAAHLANLGFPVLLLDLPPSELTREEASRGLTLEHAEVRNRPTRVLLSKAARLSPPPFCTRAAVDRVKVGNVDDDLARLRDADWIIEAVVERAEIKKAIYARIADHSRADALITSNTSGIPLRELAEGLPASRRPRFFGTHFFNPPRYLRLVELIAAPQTDRGVFEAFAEFAELALGKGVVQCRDTPGFISNRLGMFAILDALRLGLAENLSVEELDAMSGPAMARPSTATCRLVDLIGVDVTVQIASNLRAALKSDPDARAYDVPEIFDRLIQSGRLGEKTGQGFYQKTKKEGRTQILALDLRSGEYRPRQEAAWEGLPEILKIRDAKARLRALCSATGSHISDLAWRHLSEVLRYTAARVDEIAFDVVGVDRVMKWGFGWELGPFEIWDALGVEAVAKRLEAERREVPAIVRTLLQGGGKSFYEDREYKSFYFDLSAKTTREVPLASGTIQLSRLHEAGRVVEKNEGAALLDLGDRVLSLEFTSKMNVLGPLQLDLLERAIQHLSSGLWAGLVVANQGKHFSAGVDLKLFIESIRAKDWPAVDRLLKRFQDLYQALGRADRPVVVAAHGYALGAGCEIVLAANRVLLGVETFLGLPEAKVGLIPGAGGCKEMLVRYVEMVPAEPSSHAYPAVRQAWETIRSGKISGSGPEALEIGLLRPEEVRIVPNPDLLVGEAKRRILSERVSHARSTRIHLPALGEAGQEALRAIIAHERGTGLLTEASAIVAEKLAWVLCGGNAKAGEWIDEQRVLDLEREAFLSLCGLPGTLARLEQFLATGK